MLSRVLVFSRCEWLLLHKSIPQIPKTSVVISIRKFEEQVRVVLSFAITT